MSTDVNYSNELITRRNQIRAWMVRRLECSLANGTLNSLKCSLVGWVGWMINPCEYCWFTNGSTRISGINTYELKKKKLNHSTTALLNFQLWLVRKLWIISNFTSHITLLLTILPTVVCALWLWLSLSITFQIIICARFRILYWTLETEHKTT